MIIACASNRKIQERDNGNEITMSRNISINHLHEEMRDETASGKWLLSKLKINHFIIDLPNSMKQQNTKKWGQWECKT